MKATQATRISILIFYVFATGCSQAPTTTETPRPPINGRTGVDVPAPRPSEPVAPLRAGEFPKVGVLLGPGGLKTFAHLGVLRELEKKRIPVHAVVGLEWGAVVGALYSTRGSANDLEWQLFKIKSDNIPESGVLAGKVSPTSIKRLQPFLDITLAEKRIEDGSLRFACPAMTLTNGKLGWFESGRYQDAIKKCAPLPPLFEPLGSWVAGAFEIEDGAQKLRQMGAQVVIFVDVLAKGVVLKENRYENSATQQALWYTGLRRFTVGNKSVDWYVGVHGRNYDIGDWSGLRSYVIFGQEAGEKAAALIAEKYGF